jgi:hypothetical protein
MDLNDRIIFQTDRHTRELLQELESSLATQRPSWVEELSRRDETAELLKKGFKGSDSRADALETSLNDRLAGLASMLEAFPVTVAAKASEAVAAALGPLSIESDRKSDVIARAISELYRRSVASGEAVEAIGAALGTSAADAARRAEALEGAVADLSGRSAATGEAVGSLAAALGGLAADAARRAGALEGAVADLSARSAAAGEAVGSFGPALGELAEDTARRAGALEGAVADLSRGSAAAGEAIDAVRGSVAGLAARPEVPLGDITLAVGDAVSKASDRIEHAVRRAADSASASSADAGKAAVEAAASLEGRMEALVGTLAEKIVGLEARITLAEATSAQILAAAARAAAPWYRRIFR